MSIKFDLKRNEETGLLSDTFDQMAEQRKLAEQAQRVCEEKLDAVLRAIPDDIVVIDNDLNIIWTNDTAREIFGRDIVGRKCYEVYHQKNEPCEPYPCPTIQAFQDGKIHEYETQVTGKNGKIRYIHCIANVAIRDENGKPTGVLEICRDITKLKQAEQELEKLNRDLESVVWELRRTNKELQEFAYVTAHDLKTPLRGIGTLAEWISRDYADNLDEQGKQQVRLLVTRAKQMSALIDDILQYSRLGHGSPEKHQLDLNKVVSEIITGINPPENVQITIENELPVLMCEKTQIIQVFQNLLSNAVKYMDKPNGQIKVGCVEQDGFWKFSIADNGPGIDGKYHKKIFKIFQTLCPRDQVDSTGIGLSIVKKIVELNAGVVWVESELGKGSIFFFTLPKSGSRRQIPAGPTTE
jgi:PAS domain S-box-containing protein